MKYPLRPVCISLLCLATALPAQHEGDKPTPEAKPAKAGQEHKDDAATAKDAAVKAIDKFIDQKNVDKKSSTWRTSLSAPPQQKFDPDSDYFWNVETSVGSLKVQLYPDAAPNHVTSILYLARLGFYDGLTFHRIIKGFMAQGGCPLGNGRGGPGYQMAGEFEGARKHDKPGVLSTANAGPGTDGSQFFLTFQPTPSLDGKYTIAGQVVEGMDTLRGLEAAGTAGEGRLANAPTIAKAWITVVPREKPKAAEKKDGGKAKEGEKKGGEKSGG